MIKGKMLVPYLLVCALGMGFVLDARKITLTENEIQIFKSLFVWEGEMDIMGHICDVKKDKKNK
jgi:hypothetical protein